MRCKSIIFQAGLCALWLGGLSSPAWAEAGLPYVFVPDTPALAEEVNANFRYLAPPNVIHVRGDRSAADNGAALLDASDPSTLEALAGAPSAERPYLIKLHPGTYLLDRPLNLGPHVHLQGSGRGVSRIVSTATPTAIELGGASVRDLSLAISPPNGNQVTGIQLQQSASSLVSNVWIEGEGPNMRGIWSSTGAGHLHRIEHVEIQLRPTAEAMGIGVGGSGMVHLEDSKISIAGSAARLVGFSESGAVTVRGTALDISVVGEAAQAATERVWGIENRGSREKRFTNTRVWVKSNAPEVSYTIEAPTGTGSVLYFQNGALLHSFSNHYFMNFSSGNGAIRIAGSQLTSGGYRISGGAPKVACIYNYDASLNALSCMDAPD